MRKLPERDLIRQFTMNVQTPKQLGNHIRTVRKSVGLTQKQLAGVSGVGVRFLIELENGKPTCELGRALHVLSMLGITIHLQAPHLESIPVRKGSKS